MAFGKNEEPLTADGQKVVYVDRPKKPFYKRVWFWVLAPILLFIVLAAAGGSNSSQNNTPNTGGSNSNSSQQAESQENKVSLQEFYDKVQNGMTKEEVAALSGGREPSNCSEFQDEFIGKTENCNYGGFSDKGSIGITYTNDKVSSKNKFNF